MVESTLRSRRRRGARLTLTGPALLAALAAAACGPDAGAPQEAAAVPVEAGAEPSLSDDLAEPPGPELGRWREAPGSEEAELTDEQLREIEELNGIGYASGVDEAGSASGVTRYLRDETRPGVLRVTSAHAATSSLIDLEGNVLHQWALAFDEVWPGREVSKLQSFWRRTHLFENGDLLAIYEGRGIIEVDKDSHLLWANDVQAHHDLFVAADGRIYVLTREARMMPWIHPTRPVMDDAISVLSPDGALLERYSIPAAMQRSQYELDWPGLAGEHGDVLHTNSLLLLDGSLADRVPAMAAGRFLLSMRRNDMVAVLDPQSKAVVWARFGPFAGQHDARVLPSGHLSVFDNEGPGNGTSRVLEIDPVSWDVVWSYAGTPEEPFYSESCGLAQRLPDGHTLVTESDRGRAFEITPEGRVVWEYYNPHRAGERSQYIATLMEAVRLPDGFPLDWAARRP